MTVARLVRCAGAALLWAALASAGASGVTGGQSISIREAPWTVFVRGDLGASGTTAYTANCTGSVVDAKHVLTAAHCVYSTSGALLTAKDLTVEAGVSNPEALSDTASAQKRKVGSFRVHPGYVRTGGTNDDDVALLTLVRPLDLGGPLVRAVALPASGSPIPAGSTLSYAGFGQRSEGDSSAASLTRLKSTVDRQGLCGQTVGEGVIRDNAVTLCASSSRGAVCHGDSGGALVTGGANPTLVGVLSGSLRSCTPGTHSIYAFLGAPEVLRFVRGDLHPPVAPRQTAGWFFRLTYEGPLRTGYLMTCTSGGWSGNPRLTYEFVTRKGRVLQSGSTGAYRVQPADAGTSILCRVLATNAGGTTVGVTSFADPVAR